jgi:site-specific recombinase XerD
MTNIEKYFDKQLAQIKRNQLKKISLGLHIIFYLHKNKSDDSSMIYFRLTYKGKRAEISTGIRSRKQDFDSKLLTIKNNEEGTTLLQVYDKMAQQCFADLRLSGREFDVNDIKNIMSGIEYKDEIPSILAALELFLKYLTIEHQTNNYAKSTLKKYNTWHKRIGEFSAERYGKKGGLDKILSYDINSFESWLKTKKKYKHNPTQYISTHFSRFMNFCVSNRWIASDPFIMHKKKLEPENIIFLTQEEIDRIEQKEIQSAGLDRVRDTFLFMYELSMSYSDISTHRKDNLKQSTNGKQYIIKERTKTAINQIVPLSERALRLIEKYENDPYCIKRNQFVPVVAMEIMNRYLKEIAVICNINKPLSTKRARTSKITEMYATGENQERIQMIAGHSVGSSITHKHYINHSTEILINRIENLSMK